MKTTFGKLVIGEKFFDCCQVGNQDELVIYTKTSPTLARMGVNIVKRFATYLDVNEPNDRVRYSEFDDHEEVISL